MPLTAHWTVLPVDPVLGVFVRLGQKPLWQPCGSEQVMPQSPQALLLVTILVQVAGGDAPSLLQYLLPDGQSSQTVGVNAPQTWLPPQVPQVKVVWAAPVQP